MMLTSVFYSRSSSHHLIRQVIRPFIAEETKQNNIESWCIGLSNVQGDHINLSIRSVNSDHLQKRFSNLVTKFLRDYPSSKNAVKYPLTDLFMDYPNNSIQSANRRLFPYSPGEHEHAGQQAISRAILDALGNGEIDTTNIYTFLVYMQLGIIKSVYPDIQKAHDKASDLLNCLSSTTETKIEVPGDFRENNIVAQLVEKNRGMLHGIIHDVWHESTDAELEWLVEWVYACRNLISGDDFDQSFFSLSSMLSRQLGLGDKAINSLACRLIVNSFTSVKIC